MKPQSERIERIIAGIVAREGGYVDRADDAGGPTNYGITLATLSDWFGRPASVDDLKALPVDTAKRIYRDRYVHQPHFDAIADHSLKVAEELIDTGVNMGTGTAAQFLQRSLNVLNRHAKLFPELDVDGVIGGLTLSALDSFLVIRFASGERVLLTALNCLQGNRYIELAEAREKDESFIYGWLRARVTIGA